MVMAESRAEEARAVLRDDIRTLQVTVFGAAFCISRNRVSQTKICCTRRLVSVVWARKVWSLKYLRYLESVVYVSLATRIVADAWFVQLQQQIQQLTQKVQGYVASHESSPAQVRYQVEALRRCDNRSLSGSS